MPTNRLQLSFSRTPGSHVEDVLVVTAHYQTAAGALLDATMMVAVETAWLTFWGTVKSEVPVWNMPKEFRWYDQQIWPTPSPLVKTFSPSASPGSSSTYAVPPQCAISVTMETINRKRWGRFYMPCTDANTFATNQGRLTTATVDKWALAAQTMLKSCITAGAIPVVWSPRGGSGPPAFAAGTVLPINGVRVDDIVDIVRSRRWQDSPYRKHYPVP